MMTWAVFSLIKGRDGRKVSQFSVATINVDTEWQAVIDCPNREVRQRLQNHFATNVWVRVPVARSPHYMSYGWKQLEPGQEMHFREKLYRLHWLDLVAVAMEAADKK